MLDTFKAQLKAKSKTLGANLSQKRIDAIADKLHKKFPDLTEVADHDSKIDDFNDLQPLADIAKQDDRIRTLEASKGQQPTQEDDQDDDSGDTGEMGKKPAASKKIGTEEPPAWAKAIQDELKALRTEKTQTSMKQKLDTLLKDVVPASFYNGRTLPEKDEDLEAFAETIKTDHTAFKQDLINQGLMTATAPTGGDPAKLNDQGFKTAVDNWVGSQVDKKEPSKT